jgi:hypothetical protein
MLLRLAIASILALGLFVLVAKVVLPASAEGEPLVLERFFAGTTTGRGIFESRIAGVERRFVVTTNGTWNGEVLTLVEDFRYDDGETDRKIWRFTKTSDGRYTGTRDDVIGAAKIRSDNGRIHMSYDIDLPRADGTTTRLHFADILEKQPDGSVVNTARVSKFLFPVGRVEVVFSKTGK